MLSDVASIWLIKTKRRKIETPGPWSAMQHPFVQKKRGKKLNRVLVNDAASIYIERLFFREARIFFS